jgi:hypothetical protein
VNWLAENLGAVPKIKHPLSQLLPATMVSLNQIQAAIATGIKLDSYSASNIGLPVRI